MISDVRCIDNIEFMKLFPDDFFDIAIVDLEYGIGASKPSIKPGAVKQKNGSTLNVKQPNYEAKDWDFKLSSDLYMETLFAKSKKQIIFGGNYYGLKGGFLVWDKLNNNSDQFGCELAWLSFTQRTDIIYYLWAGMMQGECVSKKVKDAIRQIGNKSQNEKRIHPTQKPVKLYRYLMQNYASVGDKILDTHLGSQSSRIAASIEGFDFYGCELDAQYFADGCRRFNEHTQQQRLF